MCIDSWKASLAISLALVGCHSTYTPGSDGKIDVPNADRERLLQIIDDYAHMGHGDAERFGSLFWLDDPNMTIVENDRSSPRGPEYIRFLMDLVRERGEQAVNQQFRDTRVYFLTSGVAYSLSLREELNTKMTSRVTFIYQKKHDQWRIIHAHFSYMPE